MSAPIAGGGAQAAILGGAGAVAGSLSARNFSVGTTDFEATRPDWDFFQIATVGAPIANGATISTIAPGRGTWHVTCQIAFSNGVAGEDAIVFLASPAANGFNFDFAAPGSGSGERLMEAVMGLSLGQNVIVYAGAAIAGGTINLLWLAKRITR